MQIIDNVNELLGDNLRDTLRPGSRLRVAAATFSIFAFEALRDELEKLDEFQFVFSSPVFTDVAVEGSTAHERRQFFIPPRGLGEASLHGSEFEVRLRNRLTQRAIARECAEWLRRKARFRSNRTGRPMQQFAVVDDSPAYAPLQGFTAADLGFEQSDAVSSLTMKVGAPQAAQYAATFDAIWNDPAQVDDVTSAVYDHIRQAFAENSPARIYFLILFNVFAEFLEDMSEDAMPNDDVGHRDSQVWQSLYNFQHDAAVGIINKLEAYSGCILADSVGLGKTFTALAVIKYYELRNKSVLVLAPKKLADNWTTYTRNYTTNLFAADRLNYDVLAHTDLSRDRGESLGMDLSRVNWGNYDLVVIDESHNFRNAAEQLDRETRYQRLMRKVIREGVKTKVLMLSATPVNNRFNDLKSQLQLAYEGESEQLASKLPITGTIDAIFRQAQKAFNEWSELPPEQRTTTEILRRLDFDFFEILDAVTIARSRKHIQTFYDTSDIGAFPQRLQPESLRPALTDLPDAPTYEELYDLLASLNLAVYTPMEYVHASARAKYEERYGGDTGINRAGGSMANIGQASRERGIQRLMTVNLLKRLESSVEAFRLTLGKVRTTIGDAIRTVDLHGTTVTDLGMGFADVSEDDDVDVPTSSTVGRKVQIDLADMDTLSWRRNLDADVQVLDLILAAIAPITPDHDTKLQTLAERLRAKQDRPLNAGNRKAIIFTAFADTADYLYRNLVPLVADLRLSFAAVSGSGDPRTTLGRKGREGLDFSEVLTLFSPRSKHRDMVMKGDTREIDVLIGTDCISEGQNLQDCDFLVNYDIHWNPVRIIQRFGRIDRIGSTNAQIQMVNFWPDISLDSYINLKERVENRMVIADLSATADDNMLTQEASDAVFRREQLRRLQDEVVELEDVRTGVSITDLGLNEFRMDLLAYVNEHGPLDGVPKGLHAVVPARLDLGLRPGVIFVLRNLTADERINRGNRLHPHYLVYLSDDGEVVADHTEVKRLLDLARAGSRPHTTPVDAVTSVFNAATEDGARMGHYSDLLTTAIESIIGKAAESDVDSLFSAGPTTALTSEIRGLDDFELIAFLAVVDG
ncbi:helicase-related protein [Cellulomonas wangsupingiae]|uniref:SNF2-related protein n=1 Tax=Cellulomonas wangsupingiae TaxID=2968085 RepID=A0ABY5K7G5_9CELL|nr:SNF2-related protein [Cellulomonas wangsupingiae]MCC2333613.1 DEAD/DEAH box helicase family protein [Cellulomonas wangsupingiae]UUI64881.1 SNF2-related protein [Cellulomonas wangsupingiae]